MVRSPSFVHLKIFFILLISMVQIGLPNYSLKNNRVIDYHHLTTDYPITIYRTHIHSHKVPKAQSFTKRESPNQHTNTYYHLTNYHSLYQPATNRCLRATHVRSTDYPITDYRLPLNLFLENSLRIFRRDFLFDFSFELVHQFWGIFDELFYSITTLP